MFQLTADEMEIWKSQIVMSDSEKMGVRCNPYAFKELGVAMLSNVLNSKTAIYVNMNIMRAFVAIRQIVLVSPYTAVSPLCGVLMHPLPFIIFLNIQMI